MTEKIYMTSHSSNSIFWFFLWVIREGLGEGYDADIGFVNALESFGGGHNDPICVAFGGTSLMLSVPQF